MARRATDNVDLKKMYDLEMDLSCLASLAALELDRLRLRRAQSLYHVELLATKLSDLVLFPQGITNKAEHIPLLDPRAVVMVDEAIIEAKLGQQHETVERMVDQEGTIIRRLLEIVDLWKKSKSIRIAEVKRMGGFCLQLSTLAAADKPSPFNRQRRLPFL